MDHFAKGWYSGLAFLLLTGAWIKLFLDAPRMHAYLWAGVLLVVAIGAYCAREIFRGVALLSVERERLRRLRELEASAPAPGELF